MWLTYFEEMQTLIIVAREGMHTNVAISEPDVVGKTGAANISRALRVGITLKELTK